MANARLIYRDFFSSPDLTDLPWWGQLLFAGMIVHADDAGVIRADPSYLRNLILGCTNERRRPTLSRVREVLGLLEGRGCITRARMMSVADTSAALNVYVADTQGGVEEHTTKHDRSISCYRITNFSAFQRLKRREGKRREEEGEANARQGAPAGADNFPPPGVSEPVVTWYENELCMSRSEAIRVIKRLKVTEADLEGWKAALSDAGSKGLRDYRVYVRSRARRFQTASQAFGVNGGDKWANFDWKAFMAKEGE